MANKILSLKDAISRFISDGDHIALGGWVITRCSIASVHEIIRQRRTGLTLSQGVAGLDTDLLVGSGAVKHLNMSGGSLEDFGRLNRINEKIVNGEMEIEDYSALAMAMKFLAGAYGLPYLPIRSLLGSTILKNLIKSDPPVAIEQQCPFTGEPLVLLRALNPKTALVHVQRADSEGNSQIFGPLWDTREIVGSAEQILITAEKIVDRSEILRAPESTVIPSFKVAAVTHVPFGSYPTSCYKCYDYDADHLRDYAKVFSTSKEQFQKYLESNVFAFDDFKSYLDYVCPPSRRMGLVALQEGY